MWKDKRLVLGSAYWVLGTLRGLILSPAYWVLRAFQNGRSRLKNHESIIKNHELTDLFSGFAWWNNFGSKNSLFVRRIKPHYALLTTHYCKLFLLFTLISLSACNSGTKKAETNQQYTCSMHPQIVEDKPGSCPICGMDLTPIRGEHISTHSVDSILDAGNSKLNIETMVVKNSSYTPEVSLNGSVTYNTNQVKSISARVSGRVEKSYVKYTFEPVKKGQLLLQIYSPELVAIQQQLLYLKSKNEQELLNQTKAKLNLLGVSSQQINRILQTGKADYTINIYSNYGGYLLNPDNEKELDSQTANQPLFVKEGQYIDSGDLLFKIFNNSSLWAEFYSNTLESEWLKVGDALNLKINGISSESRIAFIQPFFKDNQNYKVIRLVLNNQKDQYKIGELATTTAKSAPIEGIWIPTQAVYQSGEKNLVFIKTESDLNPLEVKISAKAKNKFLITKGLHLGDEIAVNASYLTDSESFIRTK